MQKESENPLEDLAELIVMLRGNPKGWINETNDHFLWCPHGQSYNEQMYALIAKYPPSTSIPDDSKVEYPCLVAFYRMIPQKITARQVYSKGNKIHVNPYSIYATLVTCMGDLGCQARRFKHFGYGKMAMSFKDRGNYKQMFLKFQTWADMTPYIVEEERYILNAMEELYPSHHAIYSSTNRGQFILQI